jgi:hypothetical protein
MYFNLATANAAEAVVKARDIYIFLKANGWSRCSKLISIQATTS